jgi:hypothetical protein
MKNTAQIVAGADSNQSFRLALLSSAPKCRYKDYEGVSFCSGGNYTIGQSHRDNTPK